MCPLSSRPELQQPGDDPRRHPMDRNGRDGRLAVDQLLSCLRVIVRDVIGADGDRPHLVDRRPVLAAAEGELPLEPGPIEKELNG